MWQYLREDRWLRRVIIAQLTMSTASAVFVFLIVRVRHDDATVKRINLLDNVYDAHIGFASFSAIEGSTPASSSKNLYPVIPSKEILPYENSSCS